MAARRPPDSDAVGDHRRHPGLRGQDAAALDYPVADATLLADVLVRRYKVPADQAVICRREPRPARARHSRAAGQARRGREADRLRRRPCLQGRQGRGLLAPKNFDRKRSQPYGLVAAMAGRPDGAMSGQGEAALLGLLPGRRRGPTRRRNRRRPRCSAALKSPPGRSPFQTVTAVVSCMAGQRGQSWPAKNHGLFAWCLAEAYRGNADANRDGRVEPTELYEFLKKTMAAASSELKTAQTPQLSFPTPGRPGSARKRRSRSASWPPSCGRRKSIWRPPRRNSTRPRTLPERKSSRAFSTACSSSKRRTMRRR